VCRNFPREGLKNCQKSLSTADLFFVFESYTSNASTHKMSTTTMHFGPEWMRPKHQVSKPSPPSPPPTTAAPVSNASTYSALVTPAQPAAPERRDEAHPFRYSKEEMLRIYKEGGGRGGLGLEVERWEGVVREMETEPIGLREMGEAEKKVGSILVVAFL